MNVLITGASQGIGRALVKEFVENYDAHVLAVSRSESKLIELADAYQGNVEILAVDITQPDAMRMITEHLEQMEILDILVNNAGLLINKPFSELRKEDFQSVFDTNVFAVAELIQCCMPWLEKAKRAHVLNISSMGGVQGSAKFPGLSAYSASKGALTILTECLAEEYKQSSIKFNALSLGAVQTEMLAQAFPGYQASITPEGMAKFIANFAAHSSLVMNGKNISVSLSNP